MGSYGEVYRGDYNGTDVAVKNFFDDVMLQEGFVEVGGLRCDGVCDCY